MIDALRKVSNQGGCTTRLEGDAGVRALVRAGLPAEPAPHRGDDGRAPVSSSITPQFIAGRSRFFADFGRGCFGSTNALWKSRFGEWTKTYIKVGGEWKYLYRAVDRAGQTIDFLLRAHRDQAAARRFFERGHRPCTACRRRSRLIKSGANTAAIEGVCVPTPAPISELASVEVPQ